MSNLEVLSEQQAENLDMDMPSRSQARAFYNRLAKKYNDIGVNEVIILRDAPKNASSGNIAKIITHRDLELHVDFKVSKMLRDPEGNPIPPKDRPFLIKKLTEKAIKVL